MPALYLLPVMLLAGGGAPPSNDEVSLARGSNAFAVDLRIFFTDNLFADKHRIAVG